MDPGVSGSEDWERERRKEGERERRKVDKTRTEMTGTAWYVQCPPPHGTLTHIYLEIRSPPTHHSTPLRCFPGISKASFLPSFTSSSISYHLPQFSCVGVPQKIELSLISHLQTLFMVVCIMSKYYWIIPNNKF